MNNDLLQRLVSFIETNNLFTKHDKLLLAVSGGIDSMVLWHLLKTLEYSFVIVHCNFQLRGEESNNEENFVKVLANKENRTIHIKRFDTLQFANDNHLNIQEAARKLRYDYFQSFLKELDW